MGYEQLISGKASQVSGSFTKLFSGDFVGAVTSSLFGGLGIGGTKSKAVDAAEFQQYYSLLTNEQKNNLQAAMLNASTDTERMAILTNAVTAIKQQQLSNSASSNTRNVVLVLAAVFVLVLALFFISKMQ